MDKKVSVQYYYMISVYLIEYSETYREFKKVTRTTNRVSNENPKN